MKSEMLSQLESAGLELKRVCPDFPKIVIVLGSGLAGLLQDLEVEIEIPYSSIPGMKAVSVEGHVGRLVIGRLGNQRVACMQGRFHFYEGHSMSDVVFPYRVFALAGAEVFLLTNAAGGLQPGMKPLDLLLIRDHINMTGTNPLMGPNADELGPRFPDMTHIYDKTLGDIFIETAKKQGMPMREGVYMGIHGPSYETPAEIRMYRMMGADVVGMSTVPEAIAIRHMGKRVIGISCITNLAAGVNDEPLVHADVLTAAKKIYGKFSGIIIEAVGKVGAVIAEGKA